MLLFNLLSTNKGNFIEATSCLIKLIGVGISRTTLAHELKKHPHYPSLLSVSDVLSYFKVKNISVKTTLTRLYTLNKPFLTEMNGNGHANTILVLVKEINKDKVLLLNENNEWETIDLGQFEERWSKIILIAESNQESGEKSYRAKMYKEAISRTLFIAGLLMLPSFALISVVSLVMRHQTLEILLSSIIIMLYLIGLILCSALYLFELTNNSYMLKKICNISNSNCASFLSLNKLKILGISFSEIGFIYYFGGLSSIIIIGPGDLGVIAVLALLNILAAPLIVFSFYYQWSVAKWCFLCISIQFLLILQMVISIAGKWYFHIIEHGTFNTLMQVVPVFSLSIIVSRLINSINDFRKENTHLNIEFKYLKYDQDLFKILLEKQKKISFDPQSVGIFVGNLDATVKIIKLCNPYCDPCSLAHVELESLISANSDIQIQIVYKLLSCDLQSDPVKHFLALQEVGDIGILKEALHFWYNSGIKSYKDLEQQFPIQGSLCRQNEKIDAMYEWCVQQLTGDITPNFFLNGYELPSIYDVTDLKFLPLDHQSPLRVKL